MARAGEMGYPSALTAKTWGFYDVSFRGQEFKFQRPYGSYVMENVLFKISYPAEFHAQTAVEAAMKLRARLIDSASSRPKTIKKITIRTHEACLRIIDKKGPLANPADRDHCVQYMVAIPLLFGRLTAADYEDAVAADSAHRRAARQNRMRRRAALHRRLSRSRKALHRQCLRMELERRNDSGRNGRVSHRPSPPPRRRIAFARRKIQNQPAPPLPRSAAATDPRRLARPRTARIDAGE